MSLAHLPRHLMVGETENRAEFYCDPPMTPEEALEEKSDIYSSYVSDLPVSVKVLSSRANGYYSDRSFVEYAAHL